MVRIQDVIGRMPMLVKAKGGIFLQYSDIATGDLVVSEDPSLQRRRKGWQVRRRTMNVTYEMQLRVKQEYAPFPGVFPGDRLMWFMKEKIRDSWASYKQNRKKRMRLVVNSFLNSPTKSDPSQTYGDFMVVEKIREVDMQFEKPIGKRKERIVFPENVKKFEPKTKPKKSRLKSKGV